MIRRALLALSICASACADSEVIAITDVTVVDPARGDTEPGQTVLISGPRILEVGPSGVVGVPRGATRVAGSGRFLIPGLWDMHVHTSSDEISRQTVLPLFIANGVTGVRIVAADCFQDPGCREEGFPEALPTIHSVREWQREVAQGRQVGPRIFAGGYYMDGPPPDEPSTSFYPRTEAHGRTHARLLHERGVDFAKIYSGLSREAFFGCAAEANRLGLRFEGRTPFSVWPSEVSDTGRIAAVLAQGQLLDEEGLKAVLSEAEPTRRQTASVPREP